jgi:anti-anti-sigma factor
MPVSTRLTLRGDYDVWRRDELRLQLESVDVTREITIDLSGVTLMDAGSAALLIALKHRAAQQSSNARIVLLNTPRIVKRVLDLCRAADLFVFAVDR